MNSFLVFPTKQDAEQAEARITGNVRQWVTQALPEAIAPNGHLLGRNAATGDFDSATTSCWDLPRALADGRFAILKPTAERVAPIPLDVVLDGITTAEITQADYEAALPQAEMPTP